MRKFLLTMSFLFCALCAFAQRNITGVVAGDDGLPIPGVNVIVKGTTTGTITDLDGKFSLTVPQDATVLLFRFIGLEDNEITLGNATNYVVTMKSENTEIDEIVVTAMGIKRDRKALGYAAQDLSNEELSKAGTTSLADAINGKLTGVEIHTSSGAPGASSQIVIRGARSFDGNNQPLYVIDGMPINTTSDFSTGNSVTGANYADRSIDLNPEDIESINVLKGQAASALYGIRASNGVIVITTKRGDKNQARPLVTVSTNVSAQRVSRKFERQEVYAQGNGVNAYNPTSSMNWGPKIVDLPNDPKYGGNGKGHDGMYFNPKVAQAYGDDEAGWIKPEIHDNVGDFLGTGLTVNTNVNVSHALNGANYSLGISNSHQEGIIPSTGMKRWGARGLVDWKLTDNWSSGFSANYSSTKITSAPGANDGIINVIYSAPAEYDLKGIPTHVPGDETQQISFRNLGFVNPYWWADHNEYLQKTSRFFGNGYVEYSPKFEKDNMSLKVREQAGMDIWTSNYCDFRFPGTTASLTTGDIENYGSQHTVFNNLLTVNYDVTFGSEKEWNINVVIGNEVNHENWRTWDYYGSSFNYPGFNIINNTTNLEASEYTGEERTVGFFGSISASWANQIYLTVTGRNDYVSTMPRGARSFFYPSVSLGWEFTQLEALKNPVLTYGKLRTSFAQVGQAGHYRENYYSTPGYGGGFYGYTPVSYPLPSGVSSLAPSATIYDADLKPQNTKNFELGADLYFFNNRLKLEYTYSYQNVTDQIFGVPTAGSMGYQEMLTNAGEMKTNAHEISLNYDIVNMPDFGVDFGVNFSKIKNEVVELAPGVESIMLGGFVEPQVRAQAGCTYPNIYGNGFKRAWNGELLLLGGLPQATADSQNLGNCSPDFTMGFNLTARVKWFTLSTTWSLQKGGKMYHGTNMTMNYFGATKESLPYHEGTMVVDGIDEETGLKNTIEVDKQDYYMSYYDVTESGIYDTSLFKLRDATLTYNMPRIGDRLDISISAFARNIFLWSKLPNFDPESSQGNGNMSGYFERFSVPAASSFGGGIVVKF